MSTKEIAKKISDLSGSRNPREVFSDWVTCMAISIANMGGCQDAIWKLREDTYMSLMKHYKDNGKELGDLMGQIILELEKDPRDVLGEIFMSNELGSSKQGQFFTPFGMSELTARLTIDDLKPDQNGVISMTEVKTDEEIQINTKEKSAAAEHTARSCSNRAHDLGWQGLLAGLSLRADMVKGGDAIGCK